MSKDQQASDDQLDGEVIEDVLESGTEADA